jgi:hypothetical protein
VEALVGHLGQVPELAHRRRHLDGLHLEELCPLPQAPHVGRRRHVLQEEARLCRSERRQQQQLRVVGLARHVDVDHLVVLPDLAGQLAKDPHAGVGLGGRALGREAPRFHVCVCV